MSGIEARFVDSVADRYTCPICLLVLKEPRVTDCGHMFCWDCVRPLLWCGRFVCPVCRHEQKKSEIYPNNFHKREIMSLNIYCDQQEQGCEWNGELREREEHNETCDFVGEECNNECGATLMRKDMKSHVTDVCSNRQVECEYCNNLMMSKCLTSHYEVCEKYPVSCKFGCGVVMAKDEMNQHVKEDGSCPNSPLECKFNEAGCLFTGNRRELEIHLREDVTSHLSLVMRQLSNVSYRLSATTACLVKRERELENLKSFVTKNIRKPFLQPDTFVYEWNIRNWSNLKQEAVLEEGYSIESETFYTGSPGYCLCLVLYPDGCGRYRGSHVSVDAVVCEGDYDDLLPESHCKFSFTLIDQQCSSRNIVVTRERVINVEDNEWFDATDDFVTKEEMKSRQYIRDNGVLIQFCLELYPIVTTNEMY